MLVIADERFANFITIEQLVCLARIFAGDEGNFLAQNTQRAQGDVFEISDRRSDQVKRSGQTLCSVTLEEAVKKKSSEDALDDAPLYIRWSPDRSPYAIELRLELVSKIGKMLAEAENKGAEIGGVLVGSFPDAYMPTLRVEDVEIVPRDGGDTTYLLDPEQQALFSAIRWGIRGAGRTGIGLFRSHLRAGPLRPSPADRSLLAQEFKGTPYAALLIQGGGLQTAAFFVAQNGKLVGEPAVREFRFNETEFRALPEVQPENAAGQAKAETPRQKLWVYGIVAALLAIGIGACVLMWLFTTQSGLPQWIEASHQLRLAVAGNGQVLRISWNHGAKELDGASAATLTIADGASQRQIKLGLDELRLGAVEYERSTPHVQATMRIEKPGANPVSESAGWSGK